MKHISSYISQSGLKRQASSDWLTALWHRTAPAALQQTCHPRKYEKNCLILQVESSIWLSRIRQQQKSLIRHLRHSHDFAGLENIKLEVSPRQITVIKHKPSHHHQKLSSNNRKLLLSSASHLSDPELSQSLIRLAETASKP